MPGAVTIAVTTVTTGVTIDFASVVTEKALLGMGFPGCHHCHH
jgi:hypothetical protein